MTRSARVLLLTGGVGGSKLALGTARALAPHELVVVANTADDIEIYGAYVSPDFDTAVRTLAGRASREHGWGIEGDSFHAMEELERLGVDCWFRVGDRDLAQCLYRAEQLRLGRSRSDIDQDIRRALGVAVKVVPMTDHRVVTHVLTDSGWLHFQEYLVREKTSVRVRAIAFRGIEGARPSREFAAALDTAETIIVAPSNPLVSIAPILDLPGVRPALAASAACRVAVSPLIGGVALKGPLASMLRDLGREASSYEVARCYAGLVDVFVIDNEDRDRAAMIEQDFGMRVVITDTRMVTLEDKTRLARVVLSKGRRVRAGRAGAEIRAGEEPGS